VANIVTLGSTQTQAIGIPKTASWSILFAGALISKIGNYPYFLGCTGAANAFALALNHLSFSGRATFYDGSAVKDSGVTLALGEHATIGLTFDSVAGELRWYKNGVAALTQTVANVGGTAWQFASASAEGNTTHQALLAFAQKAIHPAEMLRFTSAPWQIFKKRPNILYFDVGGGGGATDYPTAADSSSFAITGSAANGVSAKVGVADASSYTITGSDANGAKSIVAAADSGTYTVTGSDANAIRALVSAANSSSYVITGSDAQGVVPTAGDTPSVAGSSSYAITGSDSLGTQAFVSAANSGSYVITGVDANASKSIQAVAESGSYTITGSDTSITRSFASAASSGSYVIEVGTANGVYSGEPTVTLGAGSRKKKKETKQYLVDGVLRNLTDEQAAQIMYDAANTAQQPKKIVLEDKPEPLDVPEELKKKSIFRPENLEKPKAKTPKPVFAKEVIQVKPEHVVVKQVDDDESLVLQWLERDAEDRRLLAKQLQQLYISLSGRR
jgi:hypothetical protein